MSGILNKLFTAIRGKATEAGQALVDANALTILDQQIRDADAELRTAKENLAAIMAKHKLANDGLSDKKAKAAEYGGYIQEALKQGNEALARDVATKLAELEAEIALDETNVDNYAASVVSLKRLVSQNESTIRQLRQRVDSTKANEQVLRASSAVAAANSGSSSRLRGALESLERLEANQKERVAQIDAANQLAQEVEGGDLDARLKAAGLKAGSVSADDVLARFKSPASSAA